MLAPGRSDEVHTTSQLVQGEDSGSDIHNLQFDGDPVKRIVMLLEFYVQDLVLLSTFCQNISRYSFKLIYLDPELVLKQVSGAASTSSMISQILGAAKDLSVKQLSEYISLITAEHDTCMRNLSGIYTKVLTVLDSNQSLEECKVRERMVLMYAQDLKEISLLVRKRGISLGYDPSLFKEDCKITPYIISTTVLSALRNLLEYKQKCRAHSDIDFATDSDRYDADMLQAQMPSYTSAVQFSDNEKCDNVPTALARRGGAGSSKHVSFTADPAKHSGSDHANTAHHAHHPLIDEKELDDLLDQILHSDHECGSAPADGDTTSNTALTEYGYSNQDGEENREGQEQIARSQRELDVLKILELAEEVKMLTASLDSKDERLSTLEYELVTFRNYTHKLEQDQEELTSKLALKRKEAAENSKRADEKTEELALVSKELTTKLALLKKAATEISRLKELLAQKADAVEFSTAKIEELQNEIEIKDAELRRTEDRFERMGTELAERTKALNDLRLIEMQLRQDIEEAKNGLDRTASRTKELENTLTQKTIQLDRKSEEVTLLMNENMKFSAQVIALTNSTNALKLEVEQLRLERNTSNGDVNRLSSELTQKQIDLCDALKKLELQSDKLTEVEEALSEKRLQADKLSLDLTMKVNEIAKLNAEMLTKSEEIDCKAETIQHLNREIEVLHNKLLDDTSSQARIAEVKELLNTADGLKAKVYDLESLNSELKHDRDRCKLEIDRLSLALEERDRTTIYGNPADNPLNRRPLASVLSLSRSLSSKSASGLPASAPVPTSVPIQAPISEGGGMTDLSGSFDERMGHMHTSWKKLQDALDVTEREKQELITHLQEARKLINALHAELRRYKKPEADGTQQDETDTFSTLCADIDTLKMSNQRISALQAELTASKAKNKSLREALNSLKVAYKNLLEDMNEASTLLTEKTVREEEYRTQIAALTDELQLFRAAQISGTATIDVELLSQGYSAINSELKRTTSELVETKAALQHLTAREEVLLGRLTDVAASVNLDELNKEDGMCTTEAKPSTALVDEGLQISVLGSNKIANRAVVRGIDIGIGTDTLDTNPKTDELEREISELHSTIANLTCELVQTRSECTLLKQCTGHKT